MLRKFTVAIVAGITIGLVGAAVVTHFLAGMLFGVTAGDPRTFVVAALLFTVVATIAAFVPIRRAIKGEPLTALRYE